MHVCDITYMSMFDNIFPRNTVDYRGHSISFYAFIFITLISTFRSLIHLLARDGGAGTIAGMDLSVKGANNIIAIFGQWGASQLILAFFQWVVIFRYQGLVALFLLAIAFEQALRYLSGTLKPVQTKHVPPGAFAMLLFPLSLILFFFALPQS